MFGRRSAPPRIEPAHSGSAMPQASASDASNVVAMEPRPALAAAPAQVIARINEQEQRLSDFKIAIFNDLMTVVDPAQLGELEPTQLREEISDIVSEIISMRAMVLSAAEQQVIINDMSNDMLG